MSIPIFVSECVVMCAVFGVFVFGVLFARIKRVRLPGTEHMDREYHQKWFHVKAMLPEVPVFAVGGLLVALIMTWIW